MDAVMRALEELLDNAPRAAEPAASREPEGREARGNVVPVAIL